MNVTPSADSVPYNVQRSRQRVGGRYLVDVGDEFALARHVDLLVVGSHLTLDGEEKNLQVSFLREPSHTHSQRVNGCVSIAQRPIMH